MHYIFRPKKVKGRWTQKNILSWILETLLELFWNQYNVGRNQDGKEFKYKHVCVNEHHSHILRMHLHSDILVHGLCFSLRITKETIENCYLQVLLYMYICGCSVIFLMHLVQYSYHMYDTLRTSKLIPCVVSEYLNPSLYFNPWILDLLIQNNSFAFGLVLHLCL